MFIDTCILNNTNIKTKILPLAMFKIESRPVLGLPTCSFIVNESSKSLTDRLTGYLLNYSLLKRKFVESRKSCTHDLTLHNDYRIYPVMQEC
jgi:hypothetical protein